MQGWAACTKGTHPSFIIVLLKGNCSLECSQPSQLPGSLSCVLQVSAQMALSQGGHPEHPIWNIIPPPRHPWATLPILLPHWNFFPLPLLSPDMLSILRDDLSISCPLPLHYKLHEAGIFICPVCCSNCALHRIDTQIFMDRILSCYYIVLLLYLVLIEVNMHQLV